jgi:hypothetical protein
VSLSETRFALFPDALKPSAFRAVKPLCSMIEVDAAASKAAVIAHKQG